MNDILPCLVSVPSRCRSLTTISLWLVVLAALGRVITPIQTARGAEPNSEIEAATNAHTRIVWVQDQSTSHNDSLARGKSLKLMGLDSRDGQGERAIAGTVHGYAKPLITPDGKRVVYSDHAADKVFVINWDGTGKRVVCDGFAVDVWADPTSDTEWVYVCRRGLPRDHYVYRDVARVQLDNPKVREPVWNKTQISPDNFQLSADGLRAAGEFPWPNSGIADLAARTWSKRSTGCWASIAPDNSYLCAVFDGPHRNWQMHSSDGEVIWSVNLNGSSAFGGHEGFHPRWSNHVRFLTLTGPYSVKGPINEITGGGPQVEVHIACLSEAFDRVERWVQVTHNQRGDFHPDLWIEGGSKAAVPASIARREQVAPTRRSWPTSTQDAVFVWENSSRQNDLQAANGQVIRSCKVEARGQARFDRFFAMDCGGGWFQTEGADEPLLQAARSRGEFTFEAVLSPSEVKSTEVSRIAAFADSAGVVNFALEQEQSSLYLRLRSGAVGKSVEQRAKLCDLKTPEARHLLLTAAKGGVQCWLQGKLVGPKTAIGTDFSGWEPAQLVFGGDAAGQQSWSGGLDRVAIYARSLSTDEIRENAARASEKLLRRTPVSRFKIRAELVEATAIPAPESILPYKRGLVVHHYRVKQQLEGKVGATELLVARWGILDGQRVEAEAPQAGKLVELVLERIEEHPELKSERQLMDVDRIELPLFYDVHFPPKARHGL